MVQHFSDDDLERVDAEMRAIIAEDQPFTRAEYSIDEGLALFKDQPFKVEIIEAVARGGSEEDLAEAGSDSLVSTYTQLTVVRRPVSGSPRALARRGSATFG